MKRDFFLMGLLVLFILFFISGCGGSSGCDTHNTGHDGSNSKEITYAQSIYQPPPPPPDPCQGNYGNVSVNIMMTKEEDFIGANDYKCTVNLLNCYQKPIKYHLYFHTSPSAPEQKEHGAKTFLLLNKSSVAKTITWKSFYEFYCYLELRENSTNTLINGNAVYYCTDEDCYKCQTFSNGNPSGCVSIGNQGAVEQNQNSQNSNSNSNSP